MNIGKKIVNRIAELANRLECGREVEVLVSLAVEPGDITSVFCDVQMEAEPEREGGRLDTAVSEQEEFSAGEPS